MNNEASPAHIFLATVGVLNLTETMTQIKLKYKIDRNQVGLEINTLVYVLTLGGTLKLTP